MSSIDEIRNARIRKLKLLQKKGVNPYPAESNRELSLEEAVNSFDKLEKSGDLKWISGRIQIVLIVRRGEQRIIRIKMS